MENLQEKFGARVRELRRAKKMTQENLAEITGMDIPNLSNIERGKKFVSSNTLSKLACALEVREKDLFDFEHFNNRKKLISEIINFIQNADTASLEYIYKTIVNLEQFKGSKI